MKHTPTPWILDEYGNVVSCGAEIRVKGFVLNTGNNSEATAEAKANTAHIVECVNLHDELVGALSAAEYILGFHEGSAVPEHEGAHPTIRINGEDHANILAVIRSALTKARGGYNA